MRAVRELIKSERWWNSKTAPVLALVYLMLAIGDGPPPLGDALLALLAFMVSFAGVAGYGHVVNDLFDIDHDRLAGKPNTMAARPGWQRALIVGALLLVGLLPWYWLPAAPWALTWLGVQLLLLTLYAMPPVRLKTRPVGGVLTDALYAYTVPALITCATWAPLGAAAPLAPVLVASIVAWSLLAGVRGILQHQLLDLDNDLRSGVHSFATRYGARLTRRALAGAILPAEAIALLLMSGAIAHHLPWFPLAVLLFAAWRVFQLAYLWDEPLRLPWRLAADTVTEHYGERLLGEFYTGWFPVFTLLALVLHSPVYAGLGLLHLALFKSGPVHFVAQDLRWIPGGIAKMMRRRV